MEQPEQPERDDTDDPYTQEGCTSRKWTASECRIASYVRTDYNVSYTGVKNLTVCAHVGNLFNRKPPTDDRAVNESAPSSPEQ